ncbi:MAG: hypothetical protein DRK00_04855 [Thermoprotei archaeon]|nr:MAG: hypothetical protein DRK00_04855 [Thermoprotei archaeon]
MLARHVEGRIVDFHTHVGEVRSFSRRLKGWVRAGLEDLLEYMEEAGVDWAVVLSVPCSSDPHSRIISNRALLKLVEGCEGRLVPFCSPDPRGSRAPRELRELLEEGCRGLGEVKAPIRIDDPRLDKLLEVAEELGVPALVHIEEAPGLYYCHGMGALDEVLSRHPDLKLIAHGPGWWRHISADPGTEAYPKGPVRAEGLVHKLLRKHDNLYADISATSGLNALTRDPEHAYRFLLEFQDKILYGTDFPCLSEYGQYGPDGSHLKFLKGLGLPSSALRRILRENAEQLLA